MTLTSMTPLFQVYDVRTSVDFYCHSLGFTLAESYEPDGHFYWAKITNGDSVIMFNAKWEDDSRPEERDANLAKGHGDTELYFACDDVDALYESLKSKGVNASAPAEQHGRKETVVKDPDGFKRSFYN